MPHKHWNILESAKNRIDNETIKKKNEKSPGIKQKCCFSVLSRVNVSSLVYVENSEKSRLSIEVISYERENNQINDITKVDILTAEKLKKRSKKERKSTRKV